MGLNQLNWEEASDGAWRGLSDKKDIPAAAYQFQLGMCESLQHLCDNEIRDQYGGFFSYTNMSELEPTFENEWDYEWWPEYPDQPSPPNEISDSRLEST